MYKSAYFRVRVELPAGLPIVPVVVFAGRAQADFVGRHDVILGKRGAAQLGSRKDCAREIRRKEARRMRLNTPAPDPDSDSGARRRAQSMKRSARMPTKLFLP